jgi:hypothetical protein
MALRSLQDTCARTVFVRLVADERGGEKRLSQMKAFTEAWKNALLMCPESTHLIWRPQRERDLRTNREPEKRTRLPLGGTVRKTA